MKKCYQDVLDFHTKYRAYIGTTPQVPDRGTVELRVKLLEEEYHELIDALRSNDLVKIADACCDLPYVVFGLAISYGIFLPPIWDAIQASNMNKNGGIRDDGKVLKGDDWTPPDVAGILGCQKFLNQE